MPRTNQFLSILLIGTMLSGCTLAPDYKKPDISVPGNFKEAQNSDLQGKWQEASNQAGQADLGNWWLIFKDADLNALQDQAGKANNTLKSASARLEQARALTDQARASFFPSVDLGGNAFRGNAASAAFGQAGKPTSIFQAQGTVSYEPDLFGRIRNAVNAAKYDEAASEALYNQARLMVHGDVAQNYYTLLSLDTERDLLCQSIGLREEAAKLLQRQFSEGEANEQDYLRAQAELSTTQSELAALEQQRALVEHALAILIGKAPSDFTFAEKKMPRELAVIPAGLPSTLLERRPDVATAENQLRAANERIGAARAAFFPVLNLTASGGFASSDLGDLFKWSSRSWALGPLMGTALSLPVFDGGKRKALLKQAKAGYEENVADYRQQVLIAFKDVEDNLSSLRLQSEQAKHLYDASQASSKAYHISDIRYKEGETSYLEVIETQRDMLNAQRAYTQIQGARFVTTIALIRALGGGWDMPQAPAPMIEEPATEIKAPAPVAEKTVDVQQAAKSAVPTPAETFVQEPAPIATAPASVPAYIPSVKKAPGEIEPALLFDDMNP